MLSTANPRSPRLAVLFLDECVGAKDEGQLFSWIPVVAVMVPGAQACACVWDRMLRLLRSRLSLFKCSFSPTAYVNSLQRRGPSQQHSNE